MKQIVKVGRTVRSARARAAAARAAAALGPIETPVCDKCGRPLTHVPRYLVSAPGKPTRFQCQRCFYPGTGQAPRASQIIATEETRRWADLAEYGGPSGPNGSDGSDD